MNLYGGVVFVGGPPQSGKSVLLWTRYTRHLPRVLTIEVVEETRARLVADRIACAERRTFGYGETWDALSEVAAFKRWHVIASLDRDEVEKVFRLLCPPLRSQTTRSYARAVGGLAVACGELLEMAPNGLGKNSFVKAAYLRYAHHGLTLLGATQHTPDVDPCTRMAAEHVVFLRTQDKLGLDAITRATTREIAELCRELPSYHSATCIKSAGHVYIADEQFRLYKKLDYRGVALDVSEGAPRSSGVSSTAGTLAGANR